MIYGYGDDFTGFGMVEKGTPFLSPAKVNLFLKVLSKRPDGYHNIVSIVVPVSLYDEIYFKATEDGSISLEDEEHILPDGLENTIYRAILMVKERYGIKEGIKVHVKKRIPIGSGLGGPSSNAATTLIFLSNFWGLRIGMEEMMEMGRKIGADVPLFLYGSSCIIKGIGERVTPIELPKMWFVIVYPGIAIKTKDVYNGIKIVLTKDENDITLSAKIESVQDVAKILDNDLEKVATKICPTIEVLKGQMVKQGAAGALMSGSGSSVFGIFEREDTARKAAAFFEGSYKTFLATNIDSIRSNIWGVVKR
ncbi:MAG: 4-(cytidine 5'-diphospho)-2-C-methyl-D-erythritol kinase [Syntrophorhabdaceae bacterium]|nr:4-(cytidine 5'-diphospho)-2-C-methyl-D-erythritol kinase [Syntrophorhabdaceae bacterium]